jgi:hypothetical protein
MKTILDGILDFKPEEELKVPVAIACKILISVEEILHSEMVRNKRILVSLGKTVNYLLNHGTVYEIQIEHGPEFTKKILLAMNEIMKSYSLVDEKFQYVLYCKAE